MVKSIVTTLVAILILFSGAILEQFYVADSFNDLRENLQVVYYKLEDNSAVKEDIYSIQKRWIREKKMLHVFIPHTEIKELDLWISEAVIYTEVEEYDEARAKIEVVIELTKQIPQTYLIRFENIF